MLTVFLEDRADYLLTDSLLEKNEPKARGKNLTGEYSGIWRYRIASYRLLCDMNKHGLTIRTLEVSHRSKSRNGG